MTLGVSEDHRALHDTARRWVEARGLLTAARDTLDAPTDALPAFWDELAAMGWLGLHVEEAHGGSGYGLAEAAVVLEELGRACAPGPIVTTVLAAAVIDRLGDELARSALLPGLVDGSTPGNGGLRLSAVRPTSGPPCWARSPPTCSCVPTPDGWSVLAADAVEVIEHKSLDPTRRLATVRRTGEASTALGPEPRPGLVRDLAATLLAAESMGGAAWCVETAAAYAKDREQFGRPIGQYQAVKHRCADMLGALELARAATWDAVRGGDEDEVGRGHGRHRRPGLGRLRHLRPGLRPGPRRHRLHLGARRPPLPAPGHGHPPAPRRRGGLARPGGGAGQRRGPAVDDRRPAAGGRGAPGPRSGPSSTTSGPSPGTSGTR